MRDRLRRKALTCVPHIERGRAAELGGGGAAGAEADAPVLPHACAEPRAGGKMESRGSQPPTLVLKLQGLALPHVCAGCRARCEDGLACRAPTCAATASPPRRIPAPPHPEQPPAGALTRGEGGRTNASPTQALAEPSSRLPAAARKPSGQDQHSLTRGEGGGHLQLHGGCGRIGGQRHARLRARGQGDRSQSRQACPWGLL